MNPRTSPRRPPTCSALIMLQPHPSSTPRFYGAAANRGYSPLRSNEGIHEGYEAAPAILVSFLTCASTGSTEASRCSTNAIALSVALGGGGAGLATICLLRRLRTTIPWT